LISSLFVCFLIFYLGFLVQGILSSSWVISSLGSYYFYDSSLFPVILLGYQDYSRSTILCDYLALFVLSCVGECRLWVGLVWNPLVGPKKCCVGFYYSYFFSPLFFRIARFGETVLSVSSEDILIQGRYSISSSSASIDFSDFPRILLLLGPPENPGMLPFMFFKLFLCNDC